MTAAFPYTPAAWSFGLSGLVFLLFAGKVLLSWRRSSRAYILLCALLASAAWSGTVWAALVFRQATWGWELAAVFDAIRIGSWTAFLTLLLEGRQSDSGAEFWLRRTLRYFAVPMILLLSSVFQGALPPWQEPSAGGEIAGFFYAGLGTSIFGLAITERLYRRTPASQRWAVKPLVIGIGGMFAFDLLIYSGAVLFHQLDPSMWSARGIVNAIVIGFVAVATARNRSWTVDLHVSRDVVYQSTAILLTGAYLLIVSSAAYWVQVFGGDWGGALRVALVFAALLMLAVLVLSGSMRARLRVFISKNLFSYRYDYRQEWLKFTRLLGTSEQGENLYHQVVRALADLVESTGGALWLERQGSFSQVASLNLPCVEQVEPMSGSLASFLARTDWVIHIDDIANSPDKYPGLTLPAWLKTMEHTWLIVPLPNDSTLLGFVVLARSRAQIEINWEVRDLLKTASRQAASYIAQLQAKKALMEAEQFDAFNRLSAFVVHDLKNLVAQLALVVKNAERHHGNPEFQKDMLATVEHAVGRMNQLMLQLRTGTIPIEKPRPVDLQDVMQRILRAKQNYRPSIELNFVEGIRVLAHGDRIERVIGHMIQNAIEATDARNGEDGRVVVNAFVKEGKAIIDITDNGTGMTEEFMRNQLFHPFQTTKAQGMGIGIFESMQYITSIGGSISVKSTLNVGSRFEVSLPLAGDAKTAVVTAGCEA